MSGRKRHSYSYSAPVESVTIGWNASAVELSQAEEVVEHLGLDDLGRLGHPDPVGEPGELDRRRHRDEIAVALGQGVVDGDQSVLGCLVAPARLGDLGDGGVGQRLGRGDEDDARVELEEAAVDDVHRKAPHEADVARPEQALLG